jgi:hypothetical protein
VRETASFAAHRILAHTRLISRLVELPQSLLDLGELDLGLLDSLLQALEEPSALLWAPKCWIFSQLSLTFVMPRVALEPLRKWPSEESWARSRFSLFGVSVVVRRRK